jgi:hypothetical protein
MTKAREKELYETFRKFQKKEFEEMFRGLASIGPVKKPMDPYPTVKRAKLLAERYRAQPDIFNQRPLVKILLQLRIVMSDYRFARTLRKLGIPYDSAIGCMAEYLDFEVEEGK